jgi:uncharacterized HAD superfamily protein
MKNIIFDLDDTLGNLSSPMMNALNLATGKDFTRNDSTSYFITDLYDISLEEFYEILTDFKVIENVVPLAGSREVLEHAMKDHTVHIVTARGWHPDALSITEQWFKQHDLPYHHIRICNALQSKIDCIAGIENIVLAVDDRGSHCVEFDSYDKIAKVLMMNQPWNVDIDGIHRIHDITEVLEHI